MYVCDTVALCFNRLVCAALLSSPLLQPLVMRCLWLQGAQYRNSARVKGAVASATVAGGVTGAIVGRNLLGTLIGTALLACDAKHARVRTLVMERSCWSCPCAQARWRRAL